MINIFFALLGRYVEESVHLSFSTWKRTFICSKLFHRFFAYLSWRDIIIFFSFLFISWTRARSGDYDYDTISYLWAMEVKKNLKPMSLGKARDKSCYVKFTNELKGDKSFWKVHNKDIHYKIPRFTCTKWWW